MDKNRNPAQEGIDAARTDARRGRPKNGTKPVMVRLTQVQIKRLDVAADRRGIKRSALIREMVNAL